jgi:hypothetical protein
MKILNLSAKEVLLRAQQTTEIPGGAALDPRNCRYIYNVQLSYTDPELGLCFRRGYYGILDIEACDPQQGLLTMIEDGEQSLDNCPPPDNCFGPQVIDIIFNP